MLSQGCSWHARIEEIVKKAWHRINILRAFKFKLDRDSFARMYISCIRPLLEYGGPILDNCTKEDKTLTKSIQIEAMTGPEQQNYAVLLNYTKIRDAKRFRVDITNRNCNCSIKRFMVSRQVTLIIYSTLSSRKFPILTKKCKKPANASVQYKSIV